MEKKHDYNCQVSFKTLAKLTEICIECARRKITKMNNRGECYKRPGAYPRVEHLKGA
jgi:hypothetical protein